MSRITDIAKTMKTWWDEDDDAFVQSALDEIIRIDREQLPTIEPKRGKADRPQGEWKSVKASIYPYGYDVECSVCGHRMGSSFGYKFCPMCGASMKGAYNEYDK